MRPLSWSDSMISGGPYGRVHMRSKVFSKQWVSLLASQSPWDNRVKAQIKCIIGCLSKKVKSCWTNWLNFSRCLTVAAALGGVRCHSLHALQVSTISLIMDMGICTPADWRILYIRLAEACHQRICNILNVRRTTAGFCDLSNCMLRPKSQADQSTPPGEAWSPCSRLTTTSLVRSDLTWGWSLEDEAPGFVSGTSEGSKPSSPGTLSIWAPTSILRDWVGSVVDGILGSRGSAFEERLWAARWSLACHLHSPGFKVCPTWSLGFPALHAAQSHWMDSTSGHLHSLGTLLCLGSSLYKLFWQALHFQAFLSLRLSVKGALSSFTKTPCRTRNRSEETCFSNKQTL